MDKNYTCILVAINLLLISIRVADLLLPRRLKKWLEGKFDTLTLKLSYISFFRWYSKLVNIWLLKFVGIFSLILVTSILHDSFLRVVSTALNTNPILFLGALGLSTAFALRMKGTHKSSLEYLEGKGVENFSLMVFIVRSLKVLKGFFILIVFAFVFYSASFYFIDKFIIKENLPIFIYTIICITPVSINGLGIFISLFIVLLLTFVIGIFHYLLVGVRWICWKIVSYDKGLFAAIIIVITVVLVILEICLK